MMRLTVALKDLPPFVWWRPIEFADDQITDGLEPFTRAGRKQPIEVQIELRVEEQDKDRRERDQV